MEACGPFLRDSPTYFMRTFLTYLKNVQAEMAHVVWPSKEQTFRNTLLIIVISVLVSLMIVGLDYVFTGIVAGLII